MTKRALALIALGLLGSCRSGDPAPPSVGTVSTPLMSAAEQLSGTDLPDKTLILTFDDGPAPLAVSGELATWLHDRPTPIQATFFLNGACIAATALPNDSCPSPTPNALDVIAKELAEGHLVGNHTTTHRDLTAIDPNQLVQELSETDAEIASYMPWNRMLFRAPFGFWNDSVYTTLAASPMNKYIGPVYWNIGGGPTDSTRAADWECWQNGYTTRHCGDLYLNETHALGRGIVLMHDRYGNTSNHDIDNGTGNTIDMVKYVVPTLEAEGYTFKALWEDPALAALLPTCDATCATCSGPGASQCTSCSTGSWLGQGACHACSTCPAGAHVATACSAGADTVCAPDAPPPIDAGASDGGDGDAAAPPDAGSASPVSPAATTAPADSALTPSSSVADGSADSPAPESGSGCRAAPGQRGGAGPRALALVVALAALARRRRRA